MPTLWQRRTEEDGVRWLEPIYSDTSLVTESGSAEAVDTGWHGVPVSSSTQPSLTARMLEDLGTEPEIIEAAATSWRWQRRFDKIIFSFGLPYVTDSIHTALAPGGRLIANAFGPMSAGLVLLEARFDGALSGRFTEDGGAFMPARREAGAVWAEPGERSGEARASSSRTSTTITWSSCSPRGCPASTSSTARRRVGRSAACSCRRPVG